MNSPPEILKISIYGLSKTGKTFTSELIIQSIFKQNNPNYIIYHLPAESISIQQLKQLLEKSLQNRLKFCHEILLLVVDGLETKYYADLPEMISMNNDGTKIIILFLFTISDIEYNKIINSENNKYNYILYHPYYSKDVKRILIHDWNGYLLNQINKNNLIDITIDESFFGYIALPTTKLIEYYQDQYSQNIFEIVSKISESIYQMCNCLLQDLTIHYSIFSKIQIYYENEFLAKIYDNINNLQKVIKAKEPIENVLSNSFSKNVINCDIFYL